MKIKTVGITSTAVLCVLLGMSVPGYAGQDHPDEKRDQAKPKQNSQEQARPSQPQARQAERPEQSRQQPRDQHQQPDRARQQEQRPQNDHVPQRAPNTSQQRQEQSRPQPGDQHQQPDRARQQEQRPQNDHVPQREQRQNQNRPEQRAQGDNRSQRAPEFQHSQQRGWQEHRATNWQSDHRTWRQRGGYNGYLIPDQRFRGYFGRDHGFRIGVLPFMMVGGYPRFQYRGYWFSSIDPWPEYWGTDWYDTDEVYVDYVDNGYYLFNRRYPGPGIAISVSM